MKTNFITLFFENGDYEYFNVEKYIQHHFLRNDEPVDWNYFIEEESGYNPDEVVGYLLSKDTFETMITNINLI